MLRFLGMVALLELGLLASLLAGRADDVYVLKPGPQLFVNDLLVERVEGVTRRVIQPQRFPDHPIIAAAGRLFDRIGRLEVERMEIAARSNGAIADRRAKRATVRG